MKTTTGSRRRLLESLGALWDRPSARRHLPAPRASNSESLTPVSSADRCPSRTLRGGTILIANLELEFHVSSIRITKLRFSNRKYSTLFRAPRRIEISRYALSSLVADLPLALRRPGAERPLVGKFLIGTQGLEFRAIQTKQTSSQFLIGTKCGFSNPVSQRETREKAPAGAPRIRRPCSGAALAQAGMPVLLVPLASGRRLCRWIPPL
jgi:hypothetical protein